jgi:hypothetical protein
LGFASGLKGGKLFISEQADKELGVTMNKVFKATDEVARYTRSGNAWEVTGSIADVIAKVVAESKDEDAHLVPMAAEILTNQMETREVGDKLMFNWACSVLNVKVERIA